MKDKHSMRFVIKHLHHWKYTLKIKACINGCAVNLIFIANPLIHSFNLVVVDNNYTINTIDLKPYYEYHDIIFLILQ